MQLSEYLCNFPHYIPSCNLMFNAHQYFQNFHSDTLRIYFELKFFSNNFYYFFLVLFNINSFINSFQSLCLELIYKNNKFFSVYGYLLKSKISLKTFHDLRIFHFYMPNNCLAYIHLNNNLLSLWPFTLQGIVATKCSCCLNEMKF